MDAGAYEALIRSEYRRQRNRARRIKQLRRQCILVAITVVLVVVLAFSYHAILSKASSGTDDVSFKYYTSIEVAYGESLWTIAEEYAGDKYASAQDYIHEVMEINHLQDETLIAGQYLVVPYYSTEFKQ
ncbi:MAG: LysM peptidoglycan-binding domain-containing protein [Lachnospiraceae bacterium]